MVGERKQSDEQPTLIRLYWYVEWYWCSLADSSFDQIMIGKVEAKMEFVSNLTSLCSLTATVEAKYLLQLVRHQ